MAAFDWLTGDSSEARQGRRDARARQAAEAQLRADEHVAWLKGLSPDARRAYDLAQEVSRLEDEARRSERRIQRLEETVTEERIRRIRAEG